MTNLLLDWVGPSNLVPTPGGAQFQPPDWSGIYLWTIEESPNRFRISYVGESGNIRNRLYQHIHSILGGAYWLFEDREAQNSGKYGKNKAYKPADFLEKYLGDFPYYADLAYKNLTAYHFFWAQLDGDKNLRKAAEDLIIVAANKAKDPLQNDVKRSQSRIQNDIVVESEFHDGVEMPALRNPTTAYGIGT